MLVKENIQDIYPLSGLQEGIFFHAYFGERDAYLIQTVFRFSGRFELSAIESAFNALIARHDILRTVFIQKGNHPPLQVVLRERRVAVYYQELSAAGIEAYKEQDRSNRFDLAKDPLMRLAVFPLGDDSYEIIWSHHHILMDGWCLPFLEQEFMEFYRAALYQETPRLSPPAQFGNYIRWLEQRNMAAGKVFWNKYLEGLTTVPVIDNNAPQKGESRVMDNYFIRISGVQWAVIQQYIKQEGVTLNHFIQTVWSIVLAIRNNSSDIVFGKVISGRPPEMSGIESIIGLFINTVPVRVSFTHENTFGDLLHKIWQENIDTLEHLHYPLWKMMEDHPLRQQLINHIFTFENHPDIPVTEQAGAEWELKHLTVSEPSSYDFNVVVYEEDGVVIRFDYNKTLYRKVVLKDIEKSILAVIKMATENSALKLSDMIHQISADNTVPEEMRACLDYWRQHLGTELSPEGFFRNVSGGYADTALMQVHHFKLLPDVEKEARRIGNASMQHLHMLLLSGVAGLLHFYNGAEEVFTGTGIYQQEQRKGNDFYSPVFPLKLSFSENITQKELVMQVRDRLKEAMPHARYSLEELSYNLEQYGVKIPGEMFRVAMVLENIQSLQEVLEYTPECLFAFKADDDSISCTVHYDARFYNAESIAGISAHLQEWMYQVFRRPELPLSAQTCVRAEEISLLLEQGSGPVRDYEWAPVQQLFKQHSATEAIRYKGSVIHYDTLHRRINQLTNYLKNDCHIAPGDYVAIIAGRSVEVIVAMFAIWKSGAVIVPVDPGIPQERIAFICTECGVKLVFSDQGKDYPDLKTLDLRDVFAITDQQPEHVVDVAVDIHSLAYVMYTSGSTGVPKGCLITHSNLCNYISWAKEAYFSSAAHTAWLTPLSFDFTLTTILCPLLTGNTLEIFPTEMPVNEILEYCFDEHSRINVLKLTPSHIRMAENSGIKSSNVALVITGGEALDKRQIDFLREINPAMRIINEYGPTETTVGCIVHEIGYKDEIVLIGKPVANTTVLILDKQLRHCPAGKTGELFLAGMSLGAGYLNRKELTEERFIHLPHINAAAYRTGDFAYRLADGNICFTGRKDNQVKVRGYRIELSEVEKALLEHADISGAVVLLKNDGQDEYLLAYYESAQALPLQQIREHLLSVLPVYMLPQYFMHVQRLELTANGKVNLKSLPAFSKETALGDKENAAARNDIEAKLLLMWQEVLGNRNIGIFDNFFEAGGHSLKANLLMSRIYEQFGRSIPFRSLFDNPDISSLARVIRKAAKSDLSIAPAPAAELYELSHAQTRLWILSRLHENMAAYTIPAMYIIRGHIDIPLFEAAFRQLIERHEILSTVFLNTVDGPRQKVLEDTGFVLQYSKQEGGSPEQLAASLLQQPFDLERGPLFRVKLVQTEQDTYFFMLAIHHLIADGWSMEVMMNEIISLYASAKLPPLTLQYKDYVYWQNKALQGHLLDKQAKYWHAQLKAAGEAAYTLALPLDYERPVIPSYQGDNLVLHLSAAEAAALYAWSNETGISVFSILFSVSSIALARFSGQHTFYLGTVSSGRKHPQLAQLIGYFLNTIALKQEIINDESFSVFLQRNAALIREALENDDYPFDMLVEELKLRKSSSRSPVFDVLIVMQNKEYSTTVANSGLALEEWLPERKTSTYDLVISFSEQTAGLKIICDYSSELFDRETIMVWMKEYALLLKQLINNRSLRAEELLYAGFAEA